MNCGCGVSGINPRESGDTVKVDSSDTTSGFLADKLVAGTNVSFTVLNPGGNEQLQINATPGAGSDHKVIVTGADTTPDYLLAKLAAGSIIALATLNPGANESVQINVSPGTANQVLTTDPTASFAQWSKIVNANVDVAAAIDGTKVNPAFGSQNISTSGTLNTGAATVTSLTDSGLGLGVVHSSVAGLFSSSLIVNADVDAAAAIVGTKISPDFGNQNVFTTGSIYAGASTTNTEQAGSLVTVSTGSSTIRGLVTSQHSTDTNGATIFSLKSRGTRAAPTTTVNGDTTLNIVSAAYDGSAYLRSAGIQFAVDAAVSGGSASQSISFLTGTGNSPTAKIVLTGTAPAGQIGNILLSGSPDITGVLGVHGTGIATAVAAVGDIRLRSACLISARNAANTADNQLVLVDASNNALFGDSSRTPTNQSRATTTYLVNIGGTTQLTVNTTRIEITTPGELSFAAAVGSPNIIHQVLSSGANGTRLWIHAQSVNAGGGDANGGNLVLSGGKGSGTNGLHGKISLSFNTDDTAANVQQMVEVAQLTMTRRVVALARTATITTTQMPANTGDAVTYVADAQTDPTADAVTGHIYYSTSGKPAWKFNSTTLVLSGTAATANAGAGALPATPEGFVTIILNGTVRKIPYYVT